MLLQVRRFRQGNQLKNLTESHRYGESLLKRISFCTNSRSVFCCRFCVLGRSLGEKATGLNRLGKQQQWSAERKPENTVAHSCSTLTHHTPCKLCMSDMWHTRGALPLPLTVAKRCGERDKEWKKMTRCVSWDELTDCLRCWIPPSRPLITSRD